MATALITGGSSGIGRELAKLFAKDGYHLILVARGREALEKVRDQIQEHHKVPIKIFDKDLSIPKNRQDVYDTLLRDGTTVDVLVNNAGFGDYGNFHERDWNRSQGMIDVNAAAVAHLTRLFLPGMVARRNGKILNTASTAAFLPEPLLAVYAATKGFVLHFSEAIAEELRETGVTVTALCPGPTATHFQSVAGVHNTRRIRNKVLPTPREVAVCGYRAMQKGKRVVVYGWYNRLLVLGIRFLPRAVVARLSRYAQETIKHK